MLIKKNTKKVPVTKVVKKKSAKKQNTKKVVKREVSKSVKKALIRKAIKKSAIKTSAKSKAKTKRKLILANDSTSFWMTNGQILTSLVELRDALEEMKKEVYLYHAGGDQNDFANWVEVVLIDNVCAKGLEKAGSIKAAKTVVTKRLKVYSI